MVSNEDMNNNNNNNNQKSRQVSMVDDGPLRIHIGNIPFSWSDKHLREQFEVILFVFVLKEKAFYFVYLDFWSC